MRITMALVAAIVLAFVLGAAGGYAARSVSTPAAAAAQIHAGAATCPSGMHAVVWYTAKTWSCVSD
jgi:hypothetical protein